MEGLRVVPPRSDTARGEVFCKAGRVRDLDYVYVPYRFAAVGYRRAGDVANSVQRLAVRCGKGPPLLVPSVEKRQLVRERDRLDCVQPCRPSLLVMHVLRTLPVLAQGDDAFGNLAVVGDERAGVTHRAEIL